MPKKKKKCGLWYNLTRPLTKKEANSVSLGIMRLLDYYEEKQKKKEQLEEEMKKFEMKKKELELLEKELKIRKKYAIKK